MNLEGQFADQDSGSFADSAAGVRLFMDWESWVTAYLGSSWTEADA